MLLPVSGRSTRVLAGTSTSYPTPCTSSSISLSSLTSSTPCNRPIICSKYLQICLVTHASTPAGTHAGHTNHGVLGVSMTHCHRKCICGVFAGNVGQLQQSLDHVLH